MHEDGEELSVHPSDYLRVRALTFFANPGHTSLQLSARVRSHLANPGHLWSRADVSLAAAIMPSGCPSRIWTPRRVPTRDSTATAPDCSWMRRFTSDAAKSCRCRSRVPTSPRSRENRMLSNSASPTKKRGKLKRTRRTSQSVENTGQGVREKQDTVREPGQYI